MNSKTREDEEALVGKMAMATLQLNQLHENMTRETAQSASLGTATSTFTGYHPARTVLAASVLATNLASSANTVSRPESTIFLTGPNLSRAPSSRYWPSSPLKEPVSLRLHISR